MTERFDAQDVQFGELNRRFDVQDNHFQKMGTSIQRLETTTTIGVSPTHYFNSPFPDQNQAGTLNHDGNDAQ